VPTNTSSALKSAPVYPKTPRKSFLRPPESARAPSTGEGRAISIVEKLIVYAQRLDAAVVNRIGPNDTTMPPWGAMER